MGEGACAEVVEGVAEDMIVGGEETAGVEAEAGKRGAGEACGTRDPARMVPVSSEPPKPEVKLIERNGAVTTSLRDGPEVAIVGGQAGHGEISPRRGEWLVERP